MWNNKLKSGFAKDTIRHPEKWMEILLPFLLLCVCRRETSQQGTENELGWGEFEKQVLGTGLVMLKDSTKEVPFKSPHSHEVAVNHLQIAGTDAKKLS